MAAEDTVAADADGGVVALGAAVLAVADADDHLGGQAGHLEDHGVVRLEGRGQGLGVGVAQVGEVAAQRGVGQDEQSGAGTSRVVDEFRDTGEVELQVAAEVGGGGRDPDAAHAVTAPAYV